MLLIDAQQMAIIFFEYNCSRSIFDVNDHAMHIERSRIPGMRFQHVKMSKSQYKNKISENEIDIREKAPNKNELPKRKATNSNDKQE